MTDPRHEPAARIVPSQDNRITSHTALQVLNMSIAGGISLYRQRLEGKKEQAKALKHKIRQASEHNNNSPLLSLPGEIRNEIYGLALAEDPNPPERVISTIWLIPESCTKSGLIAACKQLRNEGLSHFIGGRKTLVLGILSFGGNHRPFGVARDPSVTTVAFEVVFARSGSPELPRWFVELPREALLHAQDLHIDCPVEIPCRQADCFCLKINATVVLVVQGDTYSCHVWCDWLYPSDDKEAAMAVGASIRNDAIALFREKVKPQPGEVTREFKLIDATDPMSDRYAPNGRGSIYVEDMILLA